MRWFFGSLLLAPLQAQDQPKPDEDKSALTRAAARLGLLEREGRRVELASVIHLPASAVPKIGKNSVEALKKACEKLPPAEQIGPKEMFNLYLLAGPKGIHYLYDKKLLSEAHAERFKQLRDSLNHDLLSRLVHKFGPIGVNNFGSGKNCRSDHDQTIFSDTHTPQEIIAEYNRMFLEVLKAQVGDLKGMNYDPSVIELSNFDGSETFPDWRLAKSQALFDCELKRKFKSIPGNPEAYPLIGAFREIVDISSFVTPKTYTEYSIDPGSGKVTAVQRDAAEHIYKGLKPDQRRAHGAGAAIANWFFHNHHGGGKDPIEQAKYFLRNVGYGGQLAVRKDVEQPGFKIQMYEKLGGDNVEAAKKKYIGDIFHEHLKTPDGKFDEARADEFRMALDVAVKIRQNKHSAVDPDDGRLQPDMLKEWTERIQKETGMSAADSFKEAQQRYNRTKMEMMTFVMVKSFPLLAQSWLEPPRDRVQVAKKSKFHARKTRIPPLTDEKLRDALQMTHYRELRAIFELVGREKPELVRQLIDACPESHRKHLELLRRSVELERKLREPPPCAPLTYYEDLSKQAKDLLHDLKVDALYAAWKFQQYLNDPRNGAKEIGKRMWTTMLDDIQTRLGKKARIEFEGLAGRKLTEKYSVKDFFLNNMNMANGLAAVHGVEAYLAADEDKRWEAFASTVAWECFMQLPYIGEMFDVKAALEGDVSGLAMTLAGRLFPNLMKRFLLITLIVDTAVVAAKVGGYLIFEPLAKDAEDRLYLGLLPAKQAGWVVPGNRGQEALLPGLLELLEFGAEDRARCKFDKDEDETIDEKIAESKIPEAERAAEKRRRTVWVYVQKRIEEYLVKLKVVPGEYTEKKWYEEERVRVMSAILHGGEAEVHGETKTFEPLPRIIVRQYLSGALFKDPTDRDVFSGLRDKDKANMEDRLVARFMKDYEKGIEAHAHHMSIKAAVEAKMAREQVNEAMGQVYALRDALDDAAAGASPDAAQVAAECWQEHLVPPMEPVVVAQGYRVEEEEGEVARVTMTVYGNFEDQPLPWKFQIEAEDPAGKKQSVDLPGRVESIEGDAMRYAEPSRPAEIKGEVPGGRVKYTAKVQDAESRALATATFGHRTPASGADVLAKWEPGKDHVELNVQNLPPLGEKESRTVWIWRSESEDGPFFKVDSLGREPVKDRFPVSFLGKRTWYYACSTRRFIQEGVTDSPLGPVTGVAVDLDLKPPEVVSHGWDEKSRESKFVIRMPGPMPSGFNLRVYRSSRGGPLLLHHSSYFARSDKKEVEIKDGDTQPGVSHVYRFSWKLWAAESELSPELKIAATDLPEMTANVAWSTTERTETVSRSNFYGLLMFKGETARLKPTGKSKYYEEQVKEGERTLAATGEHGPAGVPREEVQALERAHLQLAEERARKKLAGAKPDRKKQIEEDLQKEKERIREKYGDLLKKVRRPDLQPGALLEMFFPVGSSAKAGAQIRALAEERDFVAPADGWLGFGVNEFTATRPGSNNFKVEVRFRADVQLEAFGNVGAPRMAVSQEGRNAAYRVQWSDKPEEPADAFMKVYRSVQLHVARSPEGPWEPSSWMLHPGEAHYYRVRVLLKVPYRRAIEWTSPVSRVDYKPPAVTVLEAPSGGGGIELLGVKQGEQDPSASIPMKKGQRIDLTATGRWNVYPTEGFPDCGPEGVPAVDHEEKVVKPIRKLFPNPKADWPDEVASGQAYTVPRLPPGALVARFHSGGEGFESELAGGRYSFTAPCDGALVLLPNCLSYPPATLPRTRKDHGSGSMKVTFSIR
jgi:hypothetical protein